MSRRIPKLAASIDRDLRAIRQRLREPAEAEFARGRLTGTQRGVMQALVQSGGLSLKELSRQMGLAHSTVSGVVDRLEMRGMVRRRTDAKDRRISRILPSPAVQQFLRNTLPRLELNPLVDALKRAGPRERDEIAAALERLRRLLEHNSI
ncbi:MAG TPA: MarR family transcriptional regulator [Bryobacteraceae bacterium]|nr:MarR family transcriptional regulator [Bryobacteraceae bacterium]